MNQSEIARLREQIELQMLAMQQGMRGMAFGTARHAFIRARMQRIEEYQGILAKQIGEEEADRVIYDLYAEVLE